MVQQIFEMRRSIEKSQEEQLMTRRENEALKLELLQFQNAQVRQQQRVDEARRAHMTNPYHAGFADTSDGGRDPYGGIMK